jgi:hypothetical protein
LRFAASRLLGHRPYPFGSKGVVQHATSPARQPQFARRRQQLGPRPTDLWSLDLS